jgi:adenine-specific DNA-methyltransferase
VDDYLSAHGASSLISWAVRSEDDRLLDPSCGDGGFIAAHRNSVGIEQDLHATRTAMARAPWALVHEGDFFAWASETVERFECSAGNPPFIRYQTFKGSIRARREAQPFVGGGIAAHPKGPLFRTIGRTT